MATTLALIAAVLVALWGVAHAIPTRRVLLGFEPVTSDNRRIVLQEWLAEAFTMWGIAGVVVAVTLAGGPETPTTRWTYRVVGCLLVSLAVLTGVTGARTQVIWFKICPVLLMCSAALLLAASFT